MINKFKTGLNMKTDTAIINIISIISIFVAGIIIGCENGV